MKATRLFAFILVMSALLGCGSDNVSGVTENIEVVDTVYADTLVIHEVDTVYSDTTILIEIGDDAPGVCGICSQQGVVAVTALSISDCKRQAEEYNGEMCAYAAFYNNRE